MPRVIEVLESQWLYDIENLSQPWVLYTVIPALLYSVFMVLKWTILTCPLWLPIYYSVLSRKIVKK